jgi:hypothetical protein
MNVAEGRTVSMEGGKGVRSGGWKMDIAIFRRDLGGYSRLT